jgi:hypothetical protein
MGFGIDVQLRLESGKRASVSSGVSTRLEVDDVVQALVWVAQRRIWHWTTALVQ